MTTPGPSPQSDEREGEQTQWMRENRYSRKQDRKIHRAIRKNDLDGPYLAVYLLDLGAKINEETTHWRETAIYLAADRGGRRAIRELLKRSPRLNEKTKWDKETVSYATAANCSLSVVELLIEAGADVNARDRRGWSILEFARRARRIETVQWITENTTLETLIENTF
ncbi:ankyrin repeat-containing domain protein [Aspergillus oleicola]